VKRDSFQIVTIQFSETAQSIVEAAMPFFQSEFGASRKTDPAHLESLLEWLGCHIVAHVKAQLQTLNCGETPIALIPFGIFSHLPLHATFIRPNSENHYRFLFHPRHVSYIYSANDLAESWLKPTALTTSSALVVDNPQPTPPVFDSLALSTFETQLVARYFESTVLSGMHATTASVCNVLPTVDLAHFSCHGTIDKARGYSGVLLLASREEFTYQHLLSIRGISAQLVVLSACSSGAPALAIEHVINLPSAFLASGAAAVLGTFWHTDELASLLLLTRFYALWRHENATPRDALGRAQEWLMFATADELRTTLSREILESPAAGILVNAAPYEKLYAHPWYWSGFFLAGL
jgi:CHAT domain-containing protein